MSASISLNVNSYPNAKVETGLLPEIQTDGPSFVPINSNCAFMSASKFFCKLCRSSICIFVPRAFSNSLYLSCLNLERDICCPLFCWCPPRYQDCGSSNQSQIPCLSYSLSINSLSRSACLKSFALFLSDSISTAL